MKTKIAGIITLLAGAFLCPAQNIGAVRFDSYGASPTFSYTYINFSPGNILLGGGAAGPAPTLGNYADEITNGTEWTVQLWGAPGANAPTNALVRLPLVNNSNAYVTATMADGAIDGLPGTWYSTEMATIPGGVPGQPGTVQVRAWYNAGGTITNYAEAMAAGVPWGQSLPANVPVIGGFDPDGGPPFLPANLPIFDNFDVSTNGSMDAQIVTQPQSLFIYTGTNAFNISVTAIGAPPLSYQWFTWPVTNNNGVLAFPNAGETALAGETNAVLTLSDVTNSAEYAVVVSNAYYSVMSARSIVDVPFIPSFLPPTNVASGVVLQWPGNATNYVLESSDTMGPGAVWNPIALNPVLVNGRYFTLTDSVSTGPAKFYRLHQQ